MLTTSGKNDALAAISSNVTHVGLITAITDWKAGTVTEASYTGYARKAISWSATEATSDSTGRQIKNSGNITFDQNTGSDQDVIGYGLWTALTSGTLKDIGLFDSDSPIVGTVDASTDLITAPAHGLSADQRVFVLTAPIGTKPDVLAENTAYYVLDSGLTTDAFKLSTTSGGSAVNPTVSGVAWFIPYTVQTVTTNSSLSFADGAIKVQR